MTVLAKIKATINSQSTEALKEMSIHLMNDFREGTDVVMNEILDVMMERMGDDFEAFAENL